MAYLLRYAPPIHIDKKSYFMPKMLLQLEMKKTKKSELNDKKNATHPEKTWHVFHSTKVNFEKQTSNQNENS